MDIFCFKGKVRIKTVNAVLHGNSFTGSFSLPDAAFT